MDNQEPEKQEPVKANRPKIFKTIAITIGAIIVVLVIFVAGVLTGLHKARFSYNWGMNYERNFVGSHTGPSGPVSGGPMGVFHDINGQDYRNPNGLSGNIESINGSNLVIKDYDNNENTVAIDNNTVIKSRGDNLKISDLKSGQHVVVIGHPQNNGTVDADFIRVFTDNNTNGSNANNSNTNASSNSTNTPSGNTNTSNNPQSQ